MLDTTATTVDPASPRIAPGSVARLFCLPDLDSLLFALPGCLADVAHFDALVLRLRDPGQSSHRRFCVDRSFARPAVEPDAGADGLEEAWWATHTGRAVDDPPAAVLFGGTSLSTRLGAARSCCILPLRVRNRELGALALASTLPGAYPRGEPERLASVAALVAVAIDTVRQRERADAESRQLAQERDRCRLLLEINNAVVTTLDFTTLLQVVSSCVQRAVPHDAASLALHDPAHRRFRVVALDDHANRLLLGAELLVPEAGSRFGCVLETARPLIRRRIDPAEFASDPWVARLVGSGFVSSCSVPLSSHGRIVGVLSLGGRSEAMFSEDGAELLGEVGQQLAIAVENAIAVARIEELTQRLAREKRYLEEEIRATADFGEIIGESPALLRVLRQIEMVAPTDSGVLIQGETGTGKELVARAIHRLSPRRERTLVKVNCAAVPAGLLESELFGHEKGAFTSAVARRIGRFELAEGGTLFLDEVSETSRELQAKLLRVLQEREFERVGGSATIRANVRIIAATNANLAGMLATGAFRADLFYRLNVFPITMPPLRERGGDILQLALWFTHKHARRMKKAIEGITPRTAAALARYEWPGNVRELENIIERGVILTEGNLLNLPLQALTGAAPVGPTGDASLEVVERQHILRVLDASGWVLSGPRGAAAKLGMKRSTLQSRMAKLGIVRPRQAFQG